jgi:hypothetical protein
MVRRVRRCERLFRSATVLILNAPKQLPESELRGRFWRQTAIARNSSFRENGLHVKRVTGSRLPMMRSRESLTHFAPEARSMPAALRNGQAERTACWIGTKAASNSTIDWFARHVLHRRPKGSYAE